MTEKLIAMRNNLGLGHKGDIIITTKERVEKNFPPLAKDIITEAFALFLIEAYNNINITNKSDMPQKLGTRYKKDETIQCFGCNEKFIITPDESVLWDTTCKKCGSGLVTRIQEDETAS